MIGSCKRALYALSLLASLAVVPPALAQDDESDWDESALDEMDSGDTADAESTLGNDEGEAASEESQADAASGTEQAAPRDTPCGEPPPGADPTDLECVDVGANPAHGRDFEWVNHKDVRDKRGSHCVYRSTVSDHRYDPGQGDPDNGIPPGTPFEDLPADWTDPESGATKADFEPMCD